MRISDWSSDVCSSDLQFLMIHEVHIFRSDLIEIERLLMRKRRRFHPIAIFPPPGDSCYLTDVDLRIELGREMLAMIAAIAIQYVERVDPVQLVLFKIGREHADRKSTRLNSSH